MRPASGAVGTRVGRDGSLLRCSGVHTLRFRFRSGLGTFALVVKVAEPARMRLLALATKFSAHRIMILAPKAVVGNWHPRNCAPYGGATGVSPVPRSKTTSTRRP